jgi:protein-tyrosine phosphatase
VTASELAARTGLPASVLFVCSGNICRSPTAEVVLRARADEAGVGAQLEVASAGIGDWHAGDAPDPRSVAAAHEHGVLLGGSARQVRRDDFKRFDLLVALDRGHARDLRAIARDPQARERVVLLREFDADAVRRGELDVPDPYYGGADGFDEVFDVVDAGCRGLLASLRTGAA